MIKQFLLLTLLIALTLSAPCGRCLFQDQICNRPQDYGEDLCSVGLKCTQLKNGYVSLCLPAAGPGEKCDVGEYVGSACTSPYYCDEDTKTCLFIPGTSKLNDKCTVDEDCASGLVCENNLCAPDDGVTCLQYACPIHQKCDFIEGKCVNKGGLDADCTTSDDCWKSTCIAGACRPLYSQVPNAVCFETEDCRPGLVCETVKGQRKCVEPKLHYLSDTGGVIWGPLCDTAENDQGCICNYAAGVEQVLVEVNPAFAITDACKKAYNEYYDCLAQHGCTTDFINYETSCNRMHCFEKEVAAETTCYPPEFRAPRCSASTSLLAILFLIAIILLH